MKAIEITGLIKQYGDIVAVDALSLTVESGELFSLLGVNGAGKSTTIKLLTCLTSPTQGDALVGGYSIKNESKEIKRLIGVSPQETAIAPGLTVRENLDLMCGIYGFDRKKAENRISMLAEQFGLTDILHRRAGKLSGGFQRRLSIAMALIGEPQILFLDEPTLGLDVLARRELWDVIRALKGKVTVILTTHYMEEAQSLSDRIGIMRGGRLLAVGTADELMAMSGVNDFESAFVSIVKEAEV